MREDLGRRLLGRECYSKGQGLRKVWESICNEYKHSTICKQSRRLCHNVCKWIWMKCGNLVRLSCEEELGRRLAGNICQREGLTNNVSKCIWKRCGNLVGFSYERRPR